jgi:hypothetical protein
MRNDVTYFDEIFTRYENENEMHKQSKKYHINLK